MSITPALMGSGTIPYTAGILNTTRGGIISGVASLGRGERTGDQSIIGNPEDFVSAPSFMCSGLTVGTAVAVEIWAPTIHETLLRRRRMIKIQNLGTGDLYIGHTSAVNSALGGPEPGFKLEAPGANNESTMLDLPLMGGASVYGIATGASCDVRVLVY